MDTVAQGGRKETASLLCCLASQHLINEDIAKASTIFKEASHLDESGVEAHYGLIYGKIINGGVDEAHEQLEFMQHTHQSFGKNSRFSFLSSLVASKKLNFSTALQQLNEALTLHISEFRQASGFEFFRKLDPHYMMLIAQEYLSAWEHSSSGDAMSVVLQRQRFICVPNLPIGGLVPSIPCTGLFRLGRGAPVF